MSSCIEIEKCATDNRKKMKTLQECEENLKEKIKLKEEQLREERIQDEINKRKKEEQNKGECTIL